MKRWNVKFAQHVQLLMKLKNKMLLCALVWTILKIDRKFSMALVTDRPNSWAQSEQKVCALLSNVLELMIAHNAVVRVRRLGASYRSKCQLIIVKFASAKTKLKYLTL